MDLQIDLQCDCGRWRELSGAPGVFQLGDRWPSLTGAESAAAERAGTLGPERGEATMPRRQSKAPSVGLSHLRVTFTADFYMGPGRADLMELIAETGSIAAAGKRMGMSYKRAWGLVQALNEGFGAPLVETSRGG